MIAVLRRFFGSNLCIPLFLIASIAVVAGCGTKNQPAAAETPKFRPADDSELAGDTAAAGAPVGDFAGANAGNPLRGQNTATPPGPAANGQAAANRATGTSSSAAAGNDLMSLLQQLDNMAQQQPRGNTQQAQLEDFIRIHTQRLALAKKALTLNPEPEMRRRIITAMYEIHQQFVANRVQNSMPQLIEFAKGLTADADPEVARIGRQALFSASLARIMAQPLESGKEITEEAKKLLDAEKGSLSESTLQVIVQTAMILNQAGFAKDAAETFEMLAAVLTVDPKLADQAQPCIVLAKYLKGDFETLIDSVFRDQPGAEAKIEAAVTQLISEAPAIPELLERLESVAHNLEATGHYQAAQNTYEKIAMAFANVSNAELTAEATKLATKGKLRMGLIGQPLAVEGVLPDGSPFDWSPYAGKVVLVDFWATWCGPCLEELPNIKQNFEQFHAKGFDVVGVNLDVAIGNLKQFLTIQGQELPWTMVTSQAVIDGKADRDWTQIPMAARCGVRSIPFVVLIGKDGKVDSIHVRGPKLRSRLTQLLGEPVKSEIPTDPTQPGPPGARPAGGKQSRATQPGAAANPVALLMTQALFAAAPVEPVAEDQAINPYRAKPDLTPNQLVAYIERMLDRPQAIQTRAGFSDAIAEACDRILAADPPATESQQLVAIRSKFAVLHRDACDGKEAADKQLMAFVEEMKDDRRPEVNREVEFFQLERRAIEAKELPLDEIAGVLKEVQDYMAQEKLTAKHLRLASSTVAVINRIESGDEREAHFATLGNLLAKSSDKEVVRYGKKIAKKPVAEEAAADR
jgi:thiol-disulfide isomerase/thioredoxin